MQKENSWPNRRCWLTKVVKVNGKWTTRPVVFTPIGTLLTDRVLVEDREVPMKGIFVLEWWENGQRLRRRIGKDVTKAQTALTKRNMRFREPPTAKINWRIYRPAAAISTRIRSAS